MRVVITPCWVRCGWWVHPVRPVLDRFFRRGLRSLDQPSQQRHNPSSSGLTMSVGRALRPQRRRADAAGGMTPTGVDRSGAQRSASLERVLAWGLRSRACSASWNRRMGTRLCGGVGAGRGNPPGYPISPTIRNQVEGEERASSLPSNTASSSLSFATNLRIPAFVNPFSPIGCLRCKSASRSCKS